jgi:hypothetical protein
VVGGMEQSPFLASGLGRQRLAIEGTKAKSSGVAGASDAETGGKCLARDTRLEEACLAMGDNAGTAGRRRNVPWSESRWKCLRRGTVLNIYRISLLIIARQHVRMVSLPRRTLPIARLLPLVSASAHQLLPP